MVFILTCVTLNLLFSCVLVVDVEPYRLTVKKDITDTAGYVAINQHTKYESSKEYIHVPLCERSFQTTATCSDHTAAALQLLASCTACAF